MEDDLEKKVQIINAVRKISECLDNRDFVTAAVATEMLPESVDKNPIYAALAIALTAKAEGEKWDNKTKELIEQTAATYKDRCTYFSENK